MQVDHEDQPTLSEVRVAQALVDRVRVAQRPPGPAALIDLVPRRSPVHTKRDEALSDRSSAFPVAQNDRAQPPPDMGVDLAHHLHLGLGGDPEEAMPSAKPRVDLNDAVTKCSFS